MGSDLYRRIESLLGLVPSFLKRLDDAGVLMDWKPPPEDGRRRSGEGEEARPSARGDVICRYGPVKLRRPIGKRRR